MRTIHASGTSVRHALARALATANLAPAEATFQVAVATVSLDERQRVLRAELTIDLVEPRPVGEWSPDALCGLVNPDGSHPLMVRLPAAPHVGVPRAYFLDILPVSQERWQRLGGAAPDPAHGALCPRVGMTHPEAASFAAQAGKRLPSGPELALAWGPGRFPWGDPIDPHRGRHGAPRYGELPEIGVHPPNERGIFDLGAWLWQWTAEGRLAGGAPAEPRLAPIDREWEAGLAPVGLRLAQDG